MSDEIMGALDKMIASPFTEKMEQMADIIRRQMIALREGREQNKAMQDLMDQMAEALESFTDSYYDGGSVTSCKITEALAAYNQFKKGE